MRKQLTVALAVAIATGAVVGITPARATYPGSTNGRLAFALRGADGNVDIYSVLPDGHALRRLTSSPSFDACSAYSPDGKQIAFRSNRSGAFEIWAMRHDGSDQHQITDLGGFSLFPDYSPDGSRIAFSGTVGDAETDDVYVTRTDGGGLVRLTDAPGNDSFPVWSPDGSRIAFISDRTGIGQVWVMDADGSHQTQLTFDPVTHDQLPDWSPDGSRIAFEAGEFGSGRIYMMDADGSNQTQLTYGPGDDSAPPGRPTGARSRSCASSRTASGRSTP
jgi:Tol biopolymer transport system component